MGSDRFEARVSDAALADLDEAIEYRLRVEGPNSALRLLDSFDALVDRLSKIPETAVKIGLSGYCWAQVESYVLVYSIDDGSSEVHVHRLHYGASNWKATLLGEGAG